MVVAHTWVQCDNNFSDWELLLLLCLCFLILCWLLELLTLVFELFVWLPILTCLCFLSEGRAQIGITEKPGW